MRRRAAVTALLATTVAAALAVAGGHASRRSCTAVSVPLPAQPGPLAAAGRTLWVGIHGKPGRLLAVDALTGRKLRSFRLPFDPLRIVPAFGSLWLTGQGASPRYAGVLEVDPRTGRFVRVIRGDRTLGTALAATASALWVGGPDIYPAGKPERSRVYLVYKLDPRRGTVVGRFRLRSTVIDLLGDGRRLWIAGWYAIVRLSESGQVLLRKPIAGSAWSLARAPGGAWAAHTFLGRRGAGVPPPAYELFRIRGSQLTTIPVDESPWQVSSAAGMVWIAAGEHSHAVRRLTGPEAQVRGIVRSIQATSDGVWIAQLQPNQLTKACA
jgi:hypothetical protein